MNQGFLRRGVIWLLALCLCLNAFVQPALALTQQQKLVAEVWRIVNRSYLDTTFNHQEWGVVREKILKTPLPNLEIAYAAVEKMLKSLGDPYTRFLNPEQYRSLQVNTSGELMGVGLQIAIDTQTHQLRVISPIADSPAEKAGIKPGDRILKIADLPTENLTLDQAAAQMRGPIGSCVTLTILREGDTAPWEVKLVRDRISLNPVIAQLDSSQEKPGIGYIRLSQFNANAASELTNAISILEKKGANGYILDLRNNSGGLLSAGIEVARLWLNPGNIIVHTVNRRGIQETVNAFVPAMTEDPLVVLVNQGTASASEILAGALQDNGRAQLVGEKTFGKGLIQSLFELSNGAGLAVTIARYETPLHRDINKLGIQPNKIVPQTAITPGQIATEVDLQYQAAMALLKEKQTLAHRSLS